MTEPEDSMMDAIDLERAESGRDPKLGQQSPEIPKPGREGNPDPDPQPPQDDPSRKPEQTDPPTPGRTPVQLP